MCVLVDHTINFQLKKSRHTLELFTARGMAGYGTFRHCIIPKSFGDAFEHVHNALNKHGGYLIGSDICAPIDDTQIISSIVRTTNA